MLGSVLGCHPHLNPLPSRERATRMFKGEVGQEGLRFAGNRFLRLLRHFMPRNDRRSECLAMTGKEAMTSKEAMCR